MKLKIDKFDRLAKRHGYINGYDLLMEFGYESETCELLYNGNNMGYEVAFKICKCLGVDNACRVIKFNRGETRDGLVAKYYKG